MDFKGFFVSVVDYFLENKTDFRNFCKMNKNGFCKLD